MRNKKLLFFFSDEKCSSSATVVPTLSALADRLGYDFESYICSRPWSWQGKVLPMVGHNHLEQFYYLANFYEEIYYCSISSYGSFQFRREVLAFGGKAISTRSNSEVLDFYKDIYSFFGLDFPKTAVIVPDFNGELTYNIAPYCSLDIMRLGGLGISEGIWTAYSKQFKASGVEKCFGVYCSPEGAEIVDKIVQGDNYASITKRIAERNVDNATQIGFIDPNCLLRWQTYFCRKKVVAVYENYEWIAFMPTVKQLSDRVGNKHVIGNQIVFEPKTQMVRNNDAVIAELGKYNLIHNLLGINPRIGFTVQTDLKLPLDWMEDEEVPTPWDEEYSDEFLLEKIYQRAVPVCFMFYAADLGHLPVLGHFLNMMCLDGMRAGIAFPSTWYEYQPELLEQLYIPLEQGGVCPNLEPLLSSVGVAVATEAEGYIAPDFLAELIGQAREGIAKAVGERRVPKGYYPFQDANPFYKKDAGEPQYDVVSELGFAYYISYKNSNTRAEILYEKNGMTVLNQQSPAWFPSYGNPLERLKEWEEDCAKRRAAWKNGAPYESVDWITFGFDTPFFGLTPNYLGEIEFDNMRNGWAKSAGMNYIYEAIQYVRRTGGADGSLFLVKPHELYRYAKLAKEQGLLRYQGEENR